MAISDPHFAAQVIDPEGKPHFFDDFGCSVLWLKRHPMQNKERSWVKDFKTKNWIETYKANWEYGTHKTPMGYGFAATTALIDKALDYETVKKMMLEGEHMAKQNMNMHQGHKK